MALTRYYRRVAPAASVAAFIESANAAAPPGAGIAGVTCELVFYIEGDALDPAVLKWLLSETYEQDAFAGASFFDAVRCRPPVAPAVAAAAAP